MSVQGLLLGHSIVRNFGQFLQTESAMPLSRFQCDLGLLNLFLRVVGHGGRKIQDVIRYDLAIVKRLRPDIVGLQIGGNDITVDTTADDLCLLIWSLVSLLRQNGVKFIFVCMILPRTSNVRIPSPMYNQIAQAANALLAAQAAAESSDVMFWHHARIVFPRDAASLRVIQDGCAQLRRATPPAAEAQFTDGIHFSHSGSKRFYQSIRGAFIQAMTKLDGAPHCSADRRT
jgi:lysophospholipase L1-like esterase